MNPSGFPRPGFAGAVSLVVMFAALARGAHDLWSATIVHAALLGWLAAFLIVSYLRRSDDAVRLPLVVPAGGLLLAAAVSAVFAANRSDAIFAVKDLAAALIAFYAGANVFRTDEDADLLQMLIIPVLWVQAATMAIQFVSSGPGMVEARGTLVNANIQAAFALFWVPPLGMRAARARRERQRFLYFSSGLIAAVAAIVLAGSTWALLCLGVAALAAVARRASRPGVARAVFAAGLALVAAALWFKLTKSEAWNVVGMPAPSGTDRLRWWASAVRMFLDHPWLGVGPGGYPSAYPAYKYGAGQSTLFAHSLPFMVLAELGLAGAAAALAFIGTWQRRAAPAFPQRGAFAAGALLFVIASLVNLGSEYLVNQVTLGLFLGMSVATVPAPAWRPRLSAAVVVSGLAVLALPFLVTPFLAGRFIVDGRALLAQGDRAAAQQRFIAAAELDPANWEAYHGLALARWPQTAAFPAEETAALSDMRRAWKLNRLNLTLARELAMMESEAAENERRREQSDGGSDS